MTLPIGSRPDPEAEDAEPDVGAGGTLEQLYALMEAAGNPAAVLVPAYKKSLVILSSVQLLEKKFPPRETLLSPWLPEKGLAMVFAERGIGKTWIGLGVDFAVAGGGHFLRWQAPGPRRVLYLDGEMPTQVIKERSSLMRTSMHRKRTSNLSRPICNRMGCPISTTQDHSNITTA